MNGFMKMKQVRRINHLLVDCNCCGIGRYDLMDIMRREFTISLDEWTGVSSLSFDEATDDDEGTYICKITTELGTAESNFTLVVNDRPGNCAYLSLHYVCVHMYCEPVSFMCYVCNIYIRMHKSLLGFLCMKIFEKCVKR